VADRRDPGARGALLIGPEFSIATRARDLAALDGRTFDVAIAGGGITGAGLARDAALRGLSVLLLEQADFASGTSSRSSRLIHGGLRYLEKRRFGLVFEALSERRTLMAIAPHLVTPLEFLFPVYEGDRHGAATIDLGLALYDALALWRGDAGHRRHTAAACLAMEPGLSAEGLAGGFTYRDARTDDARLVIENVIDARENGAVALNYARVEQRTTVDGVQRLTISDRAGAGMHEARAKLFINAAGPWVEDLAPAGARPLVGPSKGAHLVLSAERLPVGRAVVMQDTEADRILFAIPWGDRTVLGTTDTPFSGRPEDADVDASDAAYLLEFANRAFPAARLETADILSGWAGVRPLLANAEGNPSDASREHRLVVHEPGFVSLFGGKLTTYRSMAADALDRLVGRSVDRSSTGRRPLPGGRDFPVDPEERAAFVDGLVLRGHLDPAAAERLASVYGSRAPGVLTAIARMNGGSGRVVPDCPVLRGEIAFALRYEGVVHPEDFVVRRTSLIYRTGDAAAAAQGVLEDVAALSGAPSGTVSRWRRDLEIHAGRGARLWL